MPCSWARLHMISEATDAPRCVWSSARPSITASLRMNDDLGAEGDDPHQVAEVAVRRMEASCADRTSRAAVDGEPVTPGPAGREVRLVTREREDAAAVDGGVVGAAELVGDREAAYRRGRSGGADAEANRADEAIGLTHAQDVGREVCIEPDSRAGEKQRARCVYPAGAAVRELSGDYAEPAA